MMDRLLILLPAVFMALNLIAYAWISPEPMNLGAGLLCGFAMLFALIVETRK